MRPSVAMFRTASALLTMSSEQGAVVGREATCGIAADNLLTAGNEPP
jgi:hypothetical protein